MTQDRCYKCGATVVEMDSYVVDTSTMKRGKCHHTKAGCERAKDRDAKTPTDRIGFAPQHVSTAPRRTCKGCGGPVADGRTYCGEC